MSATTSRGTRALVAAGVAFFVCWQAAALAELGRSAALALGLYGFVCHVIFGKAYALVPSYFDRELAVPRAPQVTLPLSAGGTIALFGANAGFAPATVGALGRSSWLLGCLVVVGTLGWTVRDNPTGAETATGGANAHRRRVDRLANAFVPVAGLYLLVGAAVPVVDRAGVDVPLLPTAGPPVTHLLIAGTGALLLFAIGFRLLPRFLVATPRTPLVAVVLLAGALGPALLAVDFLGGVAFRIGAVLQAAAVVGFAVAYADLYWRSDRRRVGFLGVLAGVCSGVAAVVLGLHFAFAGFVPGATTAHYRLAATGFLGVSIVGVTYQFYPPAIGEMPWVDDRTATLSIGCLAGGLALEVVGLLLSRPAMTTAGRAVVLLGATAYGFVVFALFLERRG